MSLKAFIPSLLVAFGVPWLLIIVFPYLKMNHIEPVEFAGVDVDGGEGVYTTSRDGIVTLGSEVYGQEGCYYCHSQLVRPTYAGSDIWRDNLGGLSKTSNNPDTRRETHAWDFDGEHVAHVGIQRVGPDLSNFGRRLTHYLKPGSDLTPEQWVFNHLWDPRNKTGYEPDDQHLYSGSVCPSKKGLFEVKDAKLSRADGVALPTEEGKPAKVAIPGARARALAGYLLSLKKDTLNAPLPEALNYTPVAKTAK